MFRPRKGECRLEFALELNANGFVLTIILVYANHIRYFHHSFFSALKAITAARWYNKDNKVDDVVDLYFRLANANCFNNNRVKPSMLAEKLNFPRVQSNAS